VNAWTFTQVQRRQMVQNHELQTRRKITVEKPKNQQTQGPKREA
jgi:hypothetical protein